MAINVNTVYQTVLSILNKEQRGYITPDEFNKLATQVQLEIFEGYFDTLNQQLRIPQTDTEYADRQKNIDNSLAIFKTVGACTYDATGKFFLPPSNLHTIGTVIYKDEVEVERTHRNELLLQNLSSLTKPSTNFPVYIYDQNEQGINGFEDGETRIHVHPKSITSDVSASYIKKPNDVVWGFQQLGGGIWTSGPYVYHQSGSTQFEINDNEQSNVILKILSYSGVIIRDPQIVQAASQEVQKNEINGKS